MKYDTTSRIFKQLSETVSLLLWDAGAIRLDLDEPFKLASGNFSPIYINCRRIISNPSIMALFTAASHIILERRNLEFDLVAGGETAGIPFAAVLAQSLSKPMIYVRKAKKGYGLAALIEGSSPKEKRVLLVEDLITDAGSKLHFIEVIRNAKGTVNDVLVLFDRQQGGRAALQARGIELHSITDLKTALDVAGETGIIPRTELDEVRGYLDDPHRWHERRGLEYTS